MWFSLHMICLVGVIWLSFYIWFPKLWKWLFDGHFGGMSMSSIADGSSSHSTSKKIKYDVFISFRGEDTRSNITSLIHSALCRKSIKAFIDEEDLKKGNEISPTLLKAIEESKLCLVILSEDYASSRWCLDELVHILQCKKTEGQVEVIPVFYKVDPSDVRKQQKSYAGAFAKLRKHFDDKKLQEWRKALDKIGNLSGWTTNKSGTESQLIDSIVDDVINKLNDMSVASRKLRGLVGIVERIKEVEQLLQIGSLNKLGPIGIWGPGGIGKTTLACAVYNCLSIHFEACAFLENVREELKKHGPTHLKDEIFSKLMDGERFQPFTKRRLRRKKVLVVFDDVDDSEHWEQLVGEWFGRESRVIITGRDQQVLKNLNVSRIYEVKGLNDDEALHLFSLHAFKKKSPTANKKELSKRAVDYAGGIPLALVVLGRHLFSGDIEAWESALNKLERFPDKKIERVLRISYDALDDTQKEIFIDIALFLNGEKRDVVQEILDDLYATDGIRVLIDKALITITPWNTVEVHSLLQVMASQIVRPHPTNQDPRKGSRLTDAEDIYQALENDRGLETIEGISLDTSTCNREISLLPTTFAKMRRLRFLKVNGGKLCLPDHPLAFPCKLKYLNWDACPLKSLSTNFIAEMLVALDIHGSRLEKLWEGAPNLDKLKRINLSGSKHLTQAPDLSQAPNIEIVDFSHCVRLIEVPSYVRHLNKLRYLLLVGCTSLCKLSDLPKNIEMLCVLTRPTEHDTTRCRLGKHCDEWFPFLNFSSKLETFPIISEPMKRITILELEFAAIEELPPSIENLTGLKSLSLCFCEKLKFLPDSIYNLSSLNELKIGFCRKLESLPVLPSSLTKLDARCCTSLKTMSSSTPSVKQDWDDLYNRGYSWDTFEFLGCEMLDGNARRVLTEEVLFRILRYATLHSKYGPARLYPVLNRSYWPGSEILSWFSHKSEGSSICINLPHSHNQRYNSSYLGLAFCLIFEFKGLILSPSSPMLHVETTYVYPNGDLWRQRRNLDFDISYTYCESYCDGCCNIPYEETSEKNINGSLNSEYVVVFMDCTYGAFRGFDDQEEYSEVFREYIKAEERRFNNEIAACTTSTATVSFSFSVEEEYQKFAKINKCGVHLLHSQEAERFGYVSESSGDEEEEDDDDDNGGGESYSSGREAIHSESDDQEEDH